jgi:hypothetical protein
VRSLGRTLLICLLTGIFWAYFFAPGLGLPAWSGVIAGLLLCAAALLVERYRENRLRTSPPVFNDEILIHDRTASHEGMIGTLYLTNRRLLFEGYPDAENGPEIATLFDRFPTDAFPEHFISMPILKITSVVPRSTGIDAGLKIALADGRNFYFSTDETAEWMDEISTARQKLLDEPRTEDRKLFP